MTVWPATVSVPLLAPLVLAVRLNVTGAVPVLSVGDVSVIRLLLLAAVHVHALCAVTVTVAGPPSAETVTPVADSAYEQLCWVTVNV